MVIHALARQPFSLGILPHVIRDIPHRRIQWRHPLKGLPKIHGNLFMTQDGEIYLTEGIEDFFTLTDAFSNREIFVIER